MLAAGPHPSAEPAGRLGSRRSPVSENYPASRSCPASAAASAGRSPGGRATHPLFRCAAPWRRTEY